MSFTEERIREISRQVFDEQMQKFLKYELKAFEPPEMTPQNKPALLPTQPKPIDAFKDETIKYTLAQMDGSIKPIHYINDSALFGRINDDLKTHGYVWVSAGKESRWQKA